MRPHFTGRYLSACATMFAATGDPVFKRRVDQLVDGLAECHQALGSGCFSAFAFAEFEKLETLFFEGVWALLGLELTYLALSRSSHTYRVQENRFGGMPLGAGS